MRLGAYPGWSARPVRPIRGDERHPARSTHHRCAFTDRATLVIHGSTTPTGHPNRDRP
jgi:hypothetical protein